MVFVTNKFAVFVYLSVCVCVFVCSVCMYVYMLYTYIFFIQGVSGGIVNILGDGSMDYSE